MATTKRPSASKTKAKQPAKKTDATTKAKTKGKTDETITQAPSQTVTEKKAPGRPSKLTTEISERICDLTVEGMSLEAIGAIADLPSAKTICEWQRRGAEGEEPYAGFLQDLTHARERRDDETMHDCIRIADGEKPIRLLPGETEPETDERGFIVKDPKIPALDQATIQRDKLRIQTRIDLIGMRRPKRVELSTPAGRPLEIKDKGSVVDTARRMAFLIQAGLEASEDDTDEGEAE